MDFTGSSVPVVGISRSALHWLPSAVLSLWSCRPIALTRLKTAIGLADTNNKTCAETYPRLEATAREVAATKRY